jgi:two-component system, LuxR family, sensor kinase FixL
LIKNRGRIAAERLRETRQPEDEAPMASAELHALLDAAVDAIVVTDERGRISAFNAAAEHLFGYDPAEVLGEAVDILMPDPHRSRHGEYMQRYLDTGEARIIGFGREVQARRANGESFPVSLSVGEAVDAHGRRFVGILRDLSGQKAAERHARSLEARLADVGRFSLMGELAAGIAHEINQPLSAIATYAQALKHMARRDPVDVDALIEACEKIDAQARRAGQVIKDLRNFIRKQDVRTQLLDVNDVVADVLNLVEADAHAEGIRVVTEYASGLPKVPADAMQLQQVLLNLTRNSVDAMRDGLRKAKGIAICTEHDAEGNVCISVTDHGSGVSPRLGDHIFHPFVTTKREGLGVGLAISRTIVQAYKGTLSYRDNPTGGSIFVISLPAAAGAEDGSGGSQIKD